MTIVELDEVSVTVPGEGTVLEAVTLGLDSGSTLVLAGPAGAGKTAVLRVLAGLEAHTEGEIRFDGEPVDRQRPRERDVALVYAEFDNYAHRTVAGNLAFAAKLRKGQRGKQLRTRVREVAEMLGLDHLLRERPAALTLSERQLLALGRALVRDARVYAFDDPLSTVPPRERSIIRSRVLQWQAEHGRTTLWATSDVSEALTAADQVAVINQGRIHQVDAPRELIDYPIDVFVAGYLGHPGMNMVPGRLAGDVLRLPILALPLSETLIAAAGDSEVLIAGFRPSDARELPADVGAAWNELEFAAVVDEIEWSGHDEFAYIGFDLDDGAAEALEALEEALGYDVFATHVVATLANRSAVHVGQAMRVGVDPANIHVFDAETGVNLSLIAAGDFDEVGREAFVEADDAEGGYADEPTVEVGPDHAANVAKGGADAEAVVIETAADILGDEFEDEAAADEAEDAEPTPER